MYNFTEFKTPFETNLKIYIINVCQDFINSMIFHPRQTRILLKLKKIIWFPIFIMKIQIKNWNTYNSHLNKGVFTGFFICVRHFIWSLVVLVLKSPSYATVRRRFRTKRDTICSSRSLSGFYHQWLTDQPLWGELQIFRFEPSLFIFFIKKFSKCNIKL